jgi:hypothetical protein
MTDSDTVRVTIYMTPAQWSALSAWNIGSLEQGVDTWLHMSQEQGAQVAHDYAVTQQEVEAAIARTVAHHTTSSGVFDATACELVPPGAHIKPRRGGSKNGAC